MFELSRIVRFAVPPDGSPPAPPGPRPNAFAAWPAVDGLAVFVELEVHCRGNPDAESGYLVNIRTIDEAIRGRGPDLVSAALARSPRPHPAAILRDLLAQLAGPGEPLAAILLRLAWRVTPYYHLTVTRDDPDACLLAVQFDFAAAHHLRCPDLDEDGNRDLYGKCSHPHGHNYRLEVTVRAAVPAAGEDPVLPVPRLEALVAERVLDRFDHADLNADVPEFAGTASTVERIARACYDRLAPAVAETGAALDHVRVWETSRTACRYPAGS